MAAHPTCVGTMAAKSGGSDQRKERGLAVPKAF
jgi:hypothetical protein